MQSGLRSSFPWLLGATLLVACGGGDSTPDDVGPAIRRLEPQPLGTGPLGTGPLGTGEVAAAADPGPGWHFRVGPELDPTWRFEDVRLEPVHETSPSRGGPWYGLRLADAPTGRVILPGPFDPRRFNRAVLHLAFKGKLDVGVKLLADGREVVGTGLLRASGDGRPMTVMIDLSATLRRDAPLDAVAFHFTRVAHAPIFLGLDLVWTPLREWLPRADQGPQPVAIGQELRSAIGLSAARPLAARTLVPPGGVLRFGYGRPPQVRLRGRPPVLRVTTGTERGRRTVHQLTLPAGGKEALRWSEAAIGLEDLAGEQVEITFELIGGSSAICALADPRVERPRPAPRYPTVVLVTSDTHRADHLGAARSGVGVRTPFLDSLAARGVLFEDCYSTTNITTPSHASLFTGLSPRDTGLIDNVTALGDGAVTLAERFRQAGYHTLAAVSAAHLVHDQSGLGQGFDRMLVPRRDVDSSETIAGLARMLDEAGQVPLFVWLHVFDAHAPYQTPESHRWLYYDRDRNPYDPALPELRGPARPQWDPRLRDLDYPISQYRSEITYLDGQLQTLLGHPRLAQAVIAVTADHGESLGHHDLYFTHKGLYPDTLAVPLILTWPGGPRGVRVAQGVSHLDLGRTLLDLAGLADRDFPGSSLLGWVDGSPAAPPTSPGPRFAIASHGHSASVELGGWFLVLNLQRHGSPLRKKHQVELYHLEEDPGCENDLVESHHDRAAELRSLLVDWLGRADQTGLTRLRPHQDVQTLAALAELGYATEATAEREQVWFVPDPDDEWCARFER